MKKHKLIQWLPRAIVILYIAFISLLSLDVFEEYAFPEVLIALFIHLIPAFILIALLVLAWKKPKIGGICFILLAIIFTFFFHTYQDTMTFFILSGMPFLAGLFFLMDKR